MEVIKTLKVNTKILDEQIIFNEVVSKLEIKKYWNSHENKVDCGTETFEDVEFKIVKTVVEYNFKFTDKYIEEYWVLYINNDRIEGDITRIRRLKTKIVLENCIGRG